MTLAEKLKHARLSIGLNQTQVAAATGVRQSAISAYENDRCRERPKYESLVKLAAFYGRPIDWFEE